MKYYQSSKFPKFVGSTGFYVIIACCLIAIGAASWFAISRFNSANETPSSSSKSSSVFSEPSTSSNSSINSSSAVDSTSVAQTVSDEPYTSSEAAQPKPSFTIPVKGNIAKGYSDSQLQYSTTYKDMRLHTGIDIACDKGQEIKSAGVGTVTAVEDNDKLGKVVTIKHANSIVAKYCGLKDVKVEVNDKVIAGDVIGVLGDIPSECDDPTHLHLEVTKDGKTVSPLAALGLE